MAVSIINVVGKLSMLVTNTSSTEKVFYRGFVSTCPLVPMYYRGIPPPTGPLMAVERTNVVSKLSMLVIYMLCEKGLIEDWYQ